MITEKTIKEKVYEVMPVGEKDRIIFETEDGQRHETKKEAERHEKELAIQKQLMSIKQKKIKHECDLLNFYGQIWYYPQTKEELDFLEKYYGVDIDGCYFPSYRELYYDKLSINHWISFAIEDGGDYHDIMKVYSLSYVKKQINEYINTILSEE